MRRVIGLIVAFLLCVGAVDVSYAQSTEQPAQQQVSIWDKWKTTWSEIKIKAIEYWTELTNKDRVPSSTAEKQSETQTPLESSQVNAPAGQSVPSAMDAQSAATAQSLKAAVEKVKVVQTQTISKPARMGDSTLQKTKSGVPTFQMLSSKVDKNGKKIQIAVKNIPILDIGEEAQISRNEWELVMPDLVKIEFSKIQPLDSPELSSAKQVQDLVKKPFEICKPDTQIEQIKLALSEDITLESIQKIQYQINYDAIVKELPFTPMPDEKLNLIKGIILAEYNKKCHLALGLLETIPNNMSAEETQIRDYQYAACIHEMGFYTDSIPTLLKIIKDGIPQYATYAIDILVKGLPREYIKDVGTVLKNTNEAWVSEKSKNAFYYYIALSEGMKKHYDSSLLYASKVEAGHPKYPEAQYVAVVAEYMLNLIENSIKRQEKLLADLSKYKVDAPIVSLIKMNLGRIAYRNKEYKKAIENYQFIDKDNPFWIQALTEQGWMQILSKDPFGAIGNMHSLHSPYFESVYKPESYVVRTIGYLNICQYGDAYRSLSYLEKNYKSWLGQIENFKKSAGKNADYYDYVVTYLKTKAKETDGRLPMTIVREVARQKDFLNYLTAINGVVDQKNQYLFIRGLIQKDQRKVDSKIGQVQARIIDLNGKIESAKKHSELMRSVPEWKTSRDYEKSTLAFLMFERETYSFSLNSYNSFEKHSRNDLEKWNYKQKDNAGDALKDHLNKMIAQLKVILDNNEFLRYEVYSGSGENIRYVSAGGAERRMPVTAEKDTKQKWNFDGEFWADEIGHYRSSLKDNCPQDLSSNQKVK